MTLRATCPACACEADVEAFFVEPDAKRLAARLAEVEPALGRSVLGYLRLFKPAKTALRLSRAVRIVDELLALVEAGTVCKDERSGLRRPAPPAVWAAGIEQMIGQRDRLTLPIDGHGYLRAVVFGLAEEALARAERAREEGLRTGRRPAAPGGAEDPVLNAERYADRMVELSGWTKEQRDAFVNEARAKVTKP